MSQAPLPTCYMSDLFRLHDPGPGHPERPARYDAVAAAVAASGAERREAPPAPREALERVHSPAHIELIERFCAGGGGALDPDTIVTEASWEAALRAAGGAIAAVEAVAGDPGVAAFSCGRPPGHHAEPARAMGFCVFNSAAVAVAHARQALGCERVAVLDWDAHHGNGTQAIFYDDPAVLYVSLHQWPFYPGTGAADERGEGAGEGTTVNVPLSAEATDDVYAEVMDRVVAPVLKGFRADVVLVSGVFDAFVGDPLAMMSLSPEGYGAIVGAIVTAAG